MIKQLNIFFLALIALVGVTACGDDGGSTTTEFEPTSALYDRVVMKDAGDFNGIEFGMDSTAVKAQLDVEDIDYSDEYGITYYYYFDDMDYYIDVYYNDEGAVDNINASAYIYGEDDSYDSGEAEALFNDLVTYFNGKMGMDGELNGEGEEYTYYLWSNDEDELEVGLGDGEVYMYWYK